MSDMRGTLEYQNEKYRFSFSKNTLDLYPFGEKKYLLKEIGIEDDKIQKVVHGKRNADHAYASGCC